jgi:cellulose synthase/poly-beta-1,6-N-acetylglucosamine synthase-like glycosyltransferase
MSGPGWIEAARLIAAGVFVTAHAVLAVYAAHRWVLLLGWARAGRVADDPPPPVEWPVVTVQLPVHDERHVVGRLVDAACALDYPLDRLEIQILDDSTDDTTDIAETRAAAHRARGIDVRVLHRMHRDGHKAGALAAGLARARGELIAVFDADFLPPSEFLVRVVPYLGDPTIGMVQARWGHANRDESALTAGQAIALEAHFRIEQRARAAAGRFFNFNGTAGVWRRSCIEAAGGWSSETLTEDLDLSYRAQLAGWRFRYADAIEAPGDLPVDIGSLRRQQHRWAKGAMQTARKVLPRVWATELPLSVKVEAFFHLTGNATYALVLGIAALLPVMLLMPPVPSPWSLVWRFGSFAVTASAWTFFACAGRAAGLPWPRALASAPLVVALGMGLSWSQSRAVWEGLRRSGGRWDRTPKFGALVQQGTWRASRYALSASPSGLVEAGVAVACLATAALAWGSGEAAAAIFPTLLAAGSGWVAWLGLRDRLAFRRLAGSPVSPFIGPEPPLTKV